MASPGEVSGGQALFPSEMTFPVTAFFRFEGSVADLHEHRAGLLELYNPLKMQSVSVAGRQVPLETDLTTPLAYFLSRSDLQDVGYTGFLRPKRWNARAASTRSSRISRARSRS